MTLTLADIHELAVRYCPRPARWDYLLVDDYWGPAHEIAHALLSTPEERALPSYGLCDGEPGCSCTDGWCYVVEAAAMRISGHLLYNVLGRDDLSSQDWDACTRIDEIEKPSTWRASWAMLRAERLWPLPRTRAGLERLLERRLA